MLVSIDQCYFKGTESAIRKARKTLEQARFPAVNDSEYVIVRQLDIVALPSRLAQDYYRQTEQVMAAKVNGWSDSAAAADCIWFASETDLYACLSRDIAQGKAAARWFWKSFLHLIQASVSMSLTRLFLQQGKQLPALLQRLAEQRVLTPVWDQLAQTDAASLFQAVIREGLRQSILAVSSGYMEITVDKTSTSALPPLLATLLDDSPLLPSSLTPKQQLAIGIYLQTEKPHWASSTLVSESVNSLLRQFSVSAEERIAQGIETRDGKKQERLKTWTSLPAKRNTEKTHPGASNASDVDMPSRGESASTQDQSTSHEHALLVEQTVFNPETASLLHASDAAPDPAFDPSEQQLDEDTASGLTDQWYVGQGGIFYLMNILNQPLIRELLLNDAQAIAFPSGWGWLYRFAECLGLRYERNLIRCLSRFSAQDETDFLTDMPQLNAAPGIVAYAEKRYQSFGIRPSSLLDKAAHISLIRPEITICYRLQDIDIELRRSGLDIDPGWIDWLGALIRFQYKEAV